MGICPRPLELRPIEIVLLDYQQGVWSKIMKDVQIVKKKYLACNLIEFHLRIL